MLMYRQTKRDGEMWIADFNSI